MDTLQRRIRAVVWTLCILACALCHGCSIPSLESPECAAARDGVKQFYSYHFGNDMTPSLANLKARERYVTPELFSDLLARSETKVDYFTASEAPPKTFKIAKCTEMGNDKANLEVQIYWRDDAKVDQKEVQVEAVKSEQVWLINRVSN